MKAKIGDVISISEHQDSLYRLETPPKPYNEYFLRLVSKHTEYKSYYIDQSSLDCLKYKIISKEKYPEVYLWNSKLEMRL